MQKFSYFTVESVKWINGVFMKKKIITRIISGIPIGITIGYLVTIILSLIFGNGSYSPCVPELISLTGNQINAVVLQTVLCALLGMTFGGASVIWEAENLSIAKQTGLYFLITYAVMIPTAYLLNWMERTAIGFLIYSGIFVFIYIAIWISQFLRIKKEVKKINLKLNKQ